MAALVGAGLESGDVVPAVPVKEVMLSAALSMRGDAMYPDDDLMDKRLKFLRGNRPKEYRRLKQEGQAWQWAIRTALLESPQD